MKRNKEFIIMTKDCAKRVYQNRKEAKKKVKELNSYKDKTHTIYKCNICSLYHITTMSKQQSRDYTRYLRKRKNETV